jgi:signal recognition particle subunit SRP54
MGDVLSLVERAQEEFDIADAEKMTEKIMEARFDFDDFLKQMRMIKNMGSLGGLLKMIPGMSKISGDQLKQGEDELKKAEVIIGSMTKMERGDPDLLAKTPSRRRRIAKGCGRTESEVNKLIADFTRMRTMMQQMTSGNFPGMPGMPGMGGMGGGGGGLKKPKKKKKGFGTL